RKWLRSNAMGRRLVDALLRCERRTMRQLSPQRVVGGEVEIEAEARLAARPDFEARRLRRQAMAFETAFAEGVGCEPNGRLVDEVSARAAAVGHQEAGRSRRGQREEIAQPVCGEEREVDRKHEDALRAASAGDG